MLLYNNLFKQPREPSLNLVNKLLSFLLKQIFTAVTKKIIIIHQPSFSEIIKILRVQLCYGLFFKSKHKKRTGGGCLPRKPFCMFHPRVVSRLPAPQASVTAETLHVIISPFQERTHEAVSKTSGLGEF